MKYYQSIPEYYQAFGHTPPKLSYFDIRPFEQFYDEEKSEARAFDMEPFRVDFYGIGVMTQGTADAYLGRPFEGNIVFYSPYQLISFKGVARNWKGYYILFNQDYVSRCSFGPGLLNDFPFLRLDNVQPVTISTVEVAQLMPLLEKIYEEFNTVYADKFILIESYLSLILHYIKRATQTVKIDDTDSKNNAEVYLVSQYRGLIEQQLSAEEVDKETLTTGFYSGKLNIHQNHLNSVVKRVTNQTAKQLIQNALIARSKSLLIQTTLSIKEISFHLGFDEPAHFSNFFKKHTSLTPAQFRQAHRL